MGRPPIRKKGAFTAAERQQRRRARLRREKREREVEAKKEQAAATWARDEPRRRAELEAWRRTQPPGEPPLADPADELAAQILDALATEQDVDLDALVDALYRRAGRARGQPA
jgi:hypothetical protein